MKIRNKPFSLFLAATVFLHFVSVFARNSTGDGAPIFLWQINHGSSESYLLGSVHYLKKEMYPLPPAMERAFDRAEVLLVEADITGDNLARTMRLTLQRGRYDDQDSLKEHVSAEIYQRLNTVLKRYNMDIAYFTSFKPWFIAMTLAGLELMKLGYDPNLGLDRYFMQKARDHEKPKEIVELEGIDYQIDLFENMTDREAERFLASTLTEIDKYETDMDKMIQAWRSGDIEGMDELISRELKNDANRAFVQEKIIKQRNYRMARRIVEWLQTDRSCLVIVGAAHLTGKHGLIQLLRREGYTITQMCSRDRR